ncbi:MAG: NUDIX domain-containing protein [Anaerolineae bacterium]
MKPEEKTQSVTYSARIIEEATTPKHMRRMSDPDAVGIIHGCCGDTMEIYLRLDNGRVKEAAFMTDGHESAIACANLLCTMAHGLSLKEAAEIRPEALSDALGGLPKAKLHCAKLAIDTLHKALAGGQKAPGHLANIRKCVGHALLLTPAAGACIRDAEGRILLLRRTDGDNLWSFPGGMIKPGEGAADAVKREVREEIGLEVEPVTLIGAYTSPEYAFAYPNGDQVQPVTLFFECRVVGGELRPDLEEIVEARYFGPEDALPPMRPCCVAKAGDAFTFQGQAFFR